MPETTANENTPLSRQNVPASTGPGETTKRQITAAPFVLALICFLLPFIHVSCGGKKMGSLTGLQLVTGKEEAKQSGPFGTQTITGKVDSEPLAIAAVACAGLAALFSLGAVGAARILPALTGGAGVVCLLLLKKKFDDSALKEGGGMFTVEAGPGFILALILMVAGAGLCLYYFKDARKPALTGSGPASPEPPQQAAG